MTERFVDAHNELKQSVMADPDARSEYKALHSISRASG